MEKQFAASEVRRLSNRIPRSNDEIADAQEALRAFADMLEAREKAVPVAWMHFYRKNGGGTRMWFPTLVPKAEPQDGYEWVETRPLQENIRQTPADAERLADALREQAAKWVGSMYFGMSDENEQAVLKACANDVNKILAAHSAQAQPPAASVTDIDTMVNRFLSWRLPQDFAPDAGISFKPMPDEYMPHCWPTGTNLFHAGQVKEMILHMLAAQENPNG